MPMETSFQRRFNLTGYLSGRSRPFLVLLLMAVFAAITVLEWMSPPELRLTPLYVLVAAFATWFLGPRWGVLTSVLAGVMMLYVHTRAHHMTQDQLSLLVNGTVDVALFLAFVFILGEVKNLYGREHELSRTDSLTGLLNRRAFYEALEIEVQRMQRTLHPLTLVYFDLDHFKPVNDASGHAEGDRVLIQIATVLQEELRRIDIPARLGGDEFAVVLSGADAAAAHSAVEKLIARLLECMRQNHWPVTFSTGAVTFLDPMDSANHMIQLADQVMYSVKQSGRGRIAYLTWTSTTRPPVLSAK